MLSMGCSLAGCFSWQGCSRMLWPKECAATWRNIAANPDAVLFSPLQAVPGNATGPAARETPAVRPGKRKGPDGRRRRIRQVFSFLRDFEPYASERFGTISVPRGYTLRAQYLRFRAKRSRKSRKKLFQCGQAMKELKLIRIEGAKAPLDFTVYRSLC